MRVGTTRLLLFMLFCGVWATCAAFFGVMGCGLSPAHADTLRLKSGKEVKGIIVEDYQSRVVISTIDGERTIMKDSIAALHYDSEDENLVKLAERAQERRDYVKAYDFYEKAIRINPKSKAAQDGLVFCRGYLVRKQEVKKEDDIRRREEFEHFGGAAASRPARAGKKDDLATELQATLGLTLRIQDGSPAIDVVQQRSQAYKAGARAGDDLVAVWSRLTGYMSLEDVMRLLLEKPSFEMKITIERAADVAVNPRRGAASSPHDLIGASFVMRLEGLTLVQVKEGGAAAQAGLRNSDLIIAIDGQRTRYMPLQKAIGVVRASKGPTVKISFRRELIIWRAKQDDGANRTEV